MVTAALSRARSAAEPGPDRAPGPLAPARPGPGLPIPAAGPGELPLEPLLRLSLAAQGATGRGGRGRLRPHASAGGCHPVSAHLLIGPGCPLPPGRYAYDPLAHRVHARGPAPGGVPAGAVAVLTVTPRRTAAHYGHRAWPLLLLDAGHAAAALVLAARAHGGTVGHPAVRPAVCRDAAGPLLAAAAGLDHPAGEADEHPLAAVRLMPPDPCPEPWSLARWADGTGGTPWPVADSGRCAGGAAADDTGVVLRALTAAPHPGDGRENWWTPPPALPAPAGHDLLARRSAPPPLSGAPDRAHLAAVLAAAAAAGPGLRWYAATGGPPGTPGPGLLAPGPAAPGGLRRVAAGEARPTLAAWAAGQGWIADAGAVLLACGCPSGAPPHRVRADHLTAGHAVGTAQAVATRLGLRSRPLGSWQGADLGAALGEPPGRDWVVHGLALAAPGTPGTPGGGDRP
ncbi:nitroreductase [Streptomyces carminius]|uniref:Nitroreductase n=1 Tax=Streptomyces carminius TaxID=2665496 RepID=A0A2M8LPC2_9ACTN|nr:nitroreductase [Streptomyces carminius]